MSLFQRLSREIGSFRLGYSPQRPYPWRWTTPVVLGAFILLAAALAAINVPLSAYDMDQKSTFRPNDTLPPLPFSSLIPQILQHPTGDFSPQILTVGDAIQLNNSAFTFTITTAFNELDNSQPVSSFSYYNNPFSDGCDITNMTISLETDLTIAVTVTCRIPTLFTLEWSTNNAALGGPSLNPAEWNFNELADEFSDDLRAWVNQTPGYNGSLISGFGVAVEPCCNCTAEPSQAAEASMDQNGGSLLPTHPPCSSLPARFMVTTGFILWSGMGVEVKNTDIFGNPRLPSEFPGVPWSKLNALLKNTFQSLYHLVRMELGVILENQIYASPDMYNKCISDVSGDLGRDGATVSRLSTTNATLMAEWRDSVRLFNETDRVPVMPYLRSVPQLKSLGSAITSVFVSTFAMLSVVWTIFSLIAGAVAASHADTSGINEDEAHLKPQAQDLEGQQRPVEEWDISEACISVAEDKRVPVETLMQRLSTVEKNSVAMSEMQLSFAEMQLSLTETQRLLVRMRRSLRKHGILEGIDDDTQIEGGRDVKDSQALEEKAPSFASR